MQVGAVVDKDYRPSEMQMFYKDGNENHISVIYGGKILQVRVWWQQNSQVKANSRVRLLVPQEIEFPIDYSETEIDWVNNRTKIPCETIQNLEPNPVCILTSLLCDRDYSIGVQATEINTDTIKCTEFEEELLPSVFATKFRCFEKVWCHPSYSN